ncbi:DEAD/DEAH box helicase [Hyalangium sp.]|uniref:DEAD/DEAH box helicase n=1 Tax=Hyalangium sp. TaxID=2028555 RepID=UPI002D6E34EF|nr:DEAD/DEAH box helicase [Hyalangium sp.]HYH99831.1 DEAD/DEAH box helicase [Hyalangium sp.]
MNLVPSKSSTRSAARVALEPLRRWLTHDALYETAGPQMYRQGQACLDQDRVPSFEALPDLLLGQVLNRHGQPYRVAISTDADGFCAECECQTFWSQGFCKHAVALGLAFLQAGGSVSERARPPPRVERPQSPEHLREWLASHHLSHAGRIPLAVVEPFLGRGFHDTPGLYGLAHLPVTAPLDGTLDLRRHVHGATTQHLLREAVWAWLGAEVERVRRGLELEQERATGPRPPPTDARLIPWREALERARARVREQSVPRLLPGKPDVTVRERPLLLFVEEPGSPSSHLTAQGPRPGMLRVRVSVEPHALLDERGGLSCWCTPGGEARCVHALSALDTLLDMLGEPAWAPFNARLAELLFEQPAKELLAVLEKASSLAHPPPQPAGGARLSFRLEGLDERHPRLRLYLHKPLKKGGFSKGMPVSWRDREEARALLSDPRELEAFELCELTTRLPSYSSDGYFLLLRALKLLAHGSRLFAASRLDTPLRVREAPLGLAFSERAAGLMVHPSLEGVPVPPGKLQPPPAGTEVPLPWLFFEPELPRLTVINVPPGAREVLTTLREYGTWLPERVRPALLHNLTGLESAWSVSLPESMEARPVSPEPGFLLRLRPTGAEALEGELLVRPLPEAPPQRPGEGPPQVRGLRDGERVVAHRDLEAERAEALALRKRLGVLATDSSAHFLLEEPDAALDFLERLEPMTGPGLRVEWEQQQPWKLSYAPDARGLRVDVRSRRDWFGVEGGMEVDGERVELAALLEAMRHRRRFVRLSQERWLKLTEALRERLTPLADLAHPTREGLEVSKAAAPVLDALAEAGVEVHAPLDWRRLATRIRKARMRDIPLPEGLKAELRDYQREGFQWMARLAEWGGGACLADDMGLGKTLQTLALLLHRAKAGPALVVAPTSVCFNWALEAARFAPSLRVKSYREADRERLLQELKAGEVLLISYGLLVRDAERLGRVAFGTLVVDEAQTAKNPDTARAKALRGLQAEARVALTGTPVENRLSELWSLFRIVFPGLLGSRESFRKRFAEPIERERDPAARAALSRVLRPFLLRRTKAEVARELPPRIETVVPVVLSEGERRLYEQLRLSALARVGTQADEGQRFELLAALTRLRQLACHPRLGEPDSTLPSSKLERLVERVEELHAEGGRALVFSQFVQLLELAREALEGRGFSVQYLDGQTPPAERQARVEAFQRGEGEVFLISLKAGGTGLNLTAADHVIHLDPWWNPAVEDQATDRAHRIGQTRPVTVSRLVSQGTIEEAILALHAEKRELASSLLSEADGASALSPEQLLALLRFSSGQEGEPGPQP